jgi:hypothetical protein
MRETFTSGSVGRAPGNRCLYPEPDRFRRRVSLGVGLTACGGDSWRDTVRNRALLPYHEPCAEAPMALVTLQTIFQDALPASEQTHPPRPMSAAPPARSCHAGRPRWGAMGKRVPMAIWPASGTTPVGIDPARNVPLSRPSAG